MQTKEVSKENLNLSINFFYVKKLELLIKEIDFDNHLFLMKKQNLANKTPNIQYIFYRG